MYSNLDTYAFWALVLWLVSLFLVHRRLGSLERKIDRLQIPEGERKVFSPITESQPSPVALRPLPAPAPRPAPSADAPNEYWAGEYTASPLREDGTIALRRDGTVAQASIASSPAPAKKEGNSEENVARWLGRVGALAVFGGISFLVKYGYDQGWISQSGLFLLGLILGGVLIAIGHRLYSKNADKSEYVQFASAILGGGIATLYFSLWAGHSSLHVITPAVSFVLMALVTLLSLVMSIAMNSRFLAISGVLGGMLTPILASTGERHFVILSTYLLILDLGVMGVAYFKKWPWLNYLSFFGTAILYLGSYSGEPVGVTFLFVSLFFAVFLVASVLHHFVRKETSTRDDLIFVTLVAMCYFFAVSDILSSRFDDYLGFYALLLSILYLIIAYAAFTSGTRDRMLTLSLAGIATVFLSVAIPLQFDGAWVSVSWLVETLVLLGIGLALRERFVLAFGWIVFVFALGSVLQDIGPSYGYRLPPNFAVFANWPFWLTIMTAGVWAGIGALYYRHREHFRVWHGALSVTLLAANLVLLGGVTHEIDLAYDKQIASIREQSSREVVPGSARTSEYGDLYWDTSGRQVNLPKVDTQRIEEKRQERQTVVLIFWALYAVLLIVVGFAKRIAAVRIGGLALIFITAFRVFIFVWGLGPVYKIIASIGFGVLALGASFLYVRYRSQLKNVISDEPASHA